MKKIKFKWKTWLFMKIKEFLKEDMIRTAEIYEHFGVVEVYGDEFVEALKAGKYIIGADFTPFFVYQNVFHYSNGRFEMFKFKDVGCAHFSPLRLERDITILSSVDLLPQVMVGIPHYDVFFYTTKESLLDLKNIPKTMSDVLYNKKSRYR